MWYQDPKLPKIYHGPDELEADGVELQPMPEGDKPINKGLAEWIFADFMASTPGPMLDVGSKYPYLAHCFKNLGCDVLGIDNVPIVPEYSAELGVPMFMADFEAADIALFPQAGKYKMITMIHVFEHMYDPLAALRKLRQLVADDGMVFLRMPDHGVEGFQRDLTEHHYMIHPYFHQRSDILELLVQGEDLFTIHRYFPHNGVGQSDYVLRPLLRKPRVFAGLIVKNEERDLPKCLDSIKDVVDGVCIVDTGSTDKTPEVVVAHQQQWKNKGKTITYRQYLDASEKDETGDWKLWNFSKARNEFVADVEKMDADYCLWMDADDTLLTPANLKRTFYLDEYSVFGLQMHTGGPMWVHHRMWKTKLGIHFEGAIHEYPTIGGFPCLTLKDTIIHHDAAPVPGETGNQRNLRILEREWKENPTSSRTAFYLANTHNDAQRWVEAIPMYQARIDLGENYKDELLFAYLYKSRCHRQLKDNASARKTLLQGAAENPKWAEFWCELAYVAYDEGKWLECIGYCMIAYAQPNEYTQLWRENNKYTDQPARLMSWCHEHLKNRAEALHWAKVAQTHIGQPDKDWDDRVERLSRPRIALARPGAIGDVIMTLRLVPELKKQNPDCEIHYFTSPFIANELRWLMKQVGVEEAHDYAQFAADANKYEKAINLIGYPLAEGYPEKPMADHLLNYFAKEMGLEDVNADTVETKVECPPALVEGRYITMQHQAGWSVYKQWSPEKWADVIAKLDLPVYQLGAATDMKIPGANHEMMGRPLQDSIAMFANAVTHMGVDSWTNHLSGFTWGKRKMRCCILWGSTQWQAAGYFHNFNISLHLPCQPCFKEDPKISRMSRGPCNNPEGQTYDKPMHACMSGIGVERVLDNVQQLINWSKHEGRTGTV